jgi:hypothetical protein
MWHLWRRMPLKSIKPRSGYKNPEPEEANES